MAKSNTETQNRYWRVEVHYKDANAPLVYEHASMTYIKDVFFCVHMGGHAYKHPIENIWRVIEDWSSHEL